MRASRSLNLAAESSVFRPELETPLPFFFSSFLLLRFPRDSQALGPVGRSRRELDRPGCFASSTRPLMQSTPAQGNIVDPHVPPQSASTLFQIIY